MAKRKATKTGLSDATIVKKIKTVTTAIKRGAKTAAVKAIVKCTVAAMLAACGSPAQAPTLTTIDAGAAGAHKIEDGAPAIVEATGGEGGAVVDAGAWFTSSPAIRDIRP